MHFIRLSWCFNAKQELSVDEYQSSRLQNDLHVRSKTWPRVKGNCPVPKSCQVSQWSTEQPLSFKMLRNISMFKDKTGMIFVLSFFIVKWWPFFISFQKWLWSLLALHWAAITAYLVYAKRKKTQWHRNVQSVFQCVKTRADRERGVAELEKVHRKALCEVRPVSRAQESIQPLKIKVSARGHQDILPLAQAATADWQEGTDI